LADQYNDVPLPLSPDAPREDKESYYARVLGFVAECHKEAELGVKNCEGWSKIVQTMQAVSGVNPVIRPTKVSQTHINEIGSLFERARAELTDVKPSAEFKTFNEMLALDAVNYGKMWTSWYYSDGIDRKMGSVIDYALVGATGYAYQYWNKRTQRIDVMAYDGRDVRPFRPIDTTVENCAGMFMVREMSENAVKSMFPHKASQIKPDRMGTAVKLQETTRAAVMDRLVGMSPHERAQELSQPYEGRSAGMPVVDLFYFYLTDDRKNSSTTAQWVGDFRKDGTPYNNYSYKVAPGKAMYPNKRLIIFTRNCVLYDGPNIYWHGMYPISKYTVTPLSWSWLGSTPLWDCLSLQDTLNRAVRVMDDHLQKVIRPPVAGDRMSVSATELRAISEQLGGAGAQWLRNPTGEGVEVLEVPVLDPIVKDTIELMFTKMAEKVGVRDMSALLGLNQMPEGGTIDKLMFATKPETRARSRGLELFYREQGKMFLYNAAQFMTTREKFAILGPTGMTVDEYDFDPATFIPNASGDPMKRRDEASNHLRQFQFYVAPSSLLRSATTQDQMMAMALYNNQALDVQSLLERLDWPNVPQVMQRLKQKEQEMAMMAMAAAPQQMGAGGQGPGRPESFEQPPQMRDDGTLEYT
jgi:hypothetical protein